MSTYYTSYERRKMADAISARDAAIEVREAIERLARLATIAISIFIPVFMFYVATA